MSLAAGAKKFLDEVPLLDAADLDQDAFDKLVRELTRGSALEALLGLLSAERQGLLWQLAHTPITTPTEAARASVLQGKIQGLERAKETVLELTQRADAIDAIEAGGNE